MCVQSEENCPFCNFTDNSVVVYEDALVFAIISRRPINHHHVMVIPRKHYVSFIDLPDDVASRVFLIAKQLSVALRAACNPDAITHISDDDVRSSGFNLVAHYKLHLIPRFKDDEVVINWNRTDNPGLDERAQYAEDIRKHLHYDIP